MSTVIIYDKELREFLNTPKYEGREPTLWGAMERAKDAAVKGAKRDVGVRTGALRASIRGDHLGNITGQYVTIGSRLSYAYEHHQGTRPHLIRPTTTGGKLIFRSGSRVIMTSLVRHPGTKPNPYLTRQFIHFAREFRV